MKYRSFFLIAIITSLSCCSLYAQEMMKISQGIQIIQQHYDSLLSTTDTADPQYAFCLHRIKQLDDSLYQALYVYASNHLSSEESLDFIAFALGGPGYYDRKKLKELLYRLDYRLTQTPLWASCREVAESKPFIYKTGDKIRPLKLTDVKGKTANITNLAEKKYLLIQFWGTGCRTSLEQHAHLQQLAEEYKDQLTIIGVADDKNESTLKNYLEENNLPWRSFCDYKGNLSPLFRNFGVDALPSCFLLNKEGVLVAKIQGMSNIRSTLQKQWLLEARQTRKVKKDSVSIFYRLNLSDPENHSKVLDSLINMAFSSLSYSFSISGYTDYVDDYEYNLNLSAARAKKVREYLIQNGIPAERIERCQGRGEFVPVQGKPVKGPEQEYRKVDIVIEWVAKPVRFQYTTTLGNDPLISSEVKAGDNIVLSNMNFQPGMHYWLESAYPTLQKLYNFLRDNPDVTIEIRGHICCHSGPGDGQDATTGKYELSLNRAKFIRDYLVKKGIDSTRLEYHGYGHSLPLFPERNEWERMMNRRVEIKILSTGKQETTSSGAKRSLTAPARKITK